METKTKYFWGGLAIMSIGTIIFCFNVLGIAIVPAGALVLRKWL
jgi:hypothetical protein